MSRGPGTLEQLPHMVADVLAERKGPQVLLRDPAHFLGLGVASNLPADDLAHVDQVHVLVATIDGLHLHVVGTRQG